jgi:putative hydrolase of the HAD superfamily
MEINIKPNSFIIFDLDDTLYAEIDFLKSGFKHISCTVSKQIGYDIYDQMMSLYCDKLDVFKWINDSFGSEFPALSTSNLLAIYREHQPQINLRKDAADFLNRLAKTSIPMGLITDGRSVTQRNKLKALSIENLFTEIVISEEFGSEKPSERNYLFFEKRYPNYEFCFIGDNTTKDFVVPLQLGWTSICIKDNGLNIHKQSFNRLHLNLLTVSSFYDINILSDKYLIGKM